MGETAAAIYSLIETFKLSGVNPEAYLADILTRISLITKSTASHNICRATDPAPNHKRIKHVAGWTLTKCLKHVDLNGT